MKLPFDCSVCGTTFYVESSTCRKCGCSLDRSRENHAQSSFSLATILLFTTLVAICLALFSAAPGLGVAVSIFALPPLVRTTLLVWRKKQFGQQVGIGTKFGLFVGSMAVTFTIFFITMFVALLTFCLSVIGTLPLAESFGNTQRSMSLALLSATLMTLVVVGGLIFQFSKWVRRRWRRDMQNV